MTGLNKVLMIDRYIAGFCLILRCKNCFSHSPMLERCITSSNHPFLLISHFWSPPPPTHHTSTNTCKVWGWTLDITLIALVSNVTLLEWLSKFAQCWVPRESVLRGSGAHKATSTAQNLKVTLIEWHLKLMLLAWYQVFTPLDRHYTAEKFFSSPKDCNNKKMPLLKKCTLNKYKKFLKIC